ncbi:hypothetical protein RUND412_009616 [Rhizina undulata]
MSRYPQRSAPRRNPTVFSPKSAFTSTTVSASASIPTLLAPSPLPPHPSDQNPQIRGLSTAATAFALKSYFETLLLGLGWEPSITSPQSFIRQYAWVLAEELGTTEETAVKVFEEVFDKCTPNMASVCHAIIGMEEKLECSEEIGRAVRRLFRRNHECTPEELLGGREEVLDEKVGVGTLRGVKRRFGKRALWRRVFKGIFWSVFGKAEGKGKGKEE